MIDGFGDVEQKADVGMLQFCEGDAAACIDEIGEAEEVVLLCVHDLCEVVSGNDVLEVEEDDEVNEMNKSELGEGEFIGCFVSPIPGDNTRDGGKKDIDFVD